jgi:hypothetical protein
MEIQSGELCILGHWVLYFEACLLKRAFREPEFQFRNLDHLPKFFGNVKFLGGEKMVAFDLFCSKGHRFECWFKDGASFEEQKSSHMIECPICNDNKVERIFSPFAIKRNGGKQREELDSQEAFLALQVINDYIDKHFEDVGANFYKEALKIHYGEAEKKNIKGTATTEEEVILKEEGIQFFKVPIIKRMLN